jgi:hypothetical protein
MNRINEDSTDKFNGTKGTRSREAYVSIHAVNTPSTFLGYDFSQRVLPRDPVCFRFSRNLSQKKIS